MCYHTKIFHAAGISLFSNFIINIFTKVTQFAGNYRGYDKSLARPTALSIVFSVQGTGGSPTGPDPENGVGDQDS
jgi:hypothetical protein